MDALRLPWTETMVLMKVPYHWSYRLDDIDLAKEDISQIVYEVVNHKAANACDKDKRAPKPRTRKR